MKLVVDGVFFQLAKTGIARVWSSILPRLARYPDVEIVLLDRGNCPAIDGIERLEFSSYRMGGSTAADSLLIDEFCTKLGADVFSSTYYTTPATIPSVLMVYDMIPEVLRFDLTAPAWQEKQIAISFASYYACISERTRSDLQHFYPNIGNDRAIVTHCGVEREIFRPRDRAELDSFKTRFGIARPYYVLVGSRGQRQDYKNTSLVFDAVRNMRNFECELLCVGGEPVIHRDVLAGLPANISARRVELTDDEMACAYAGAEALVYPSLYEGFGLPIVEAMACGCPVITTKHGALGEISGDAAIFISGHDQVELQRAMEEVRKPQLRKLLIEKSVQQAIRYDWDRTACGFHECLRKAIDERASPGMQTFLHEWKRLRAIQAEVDC